MPRAVDLFAGAGGFSLGASMAGFEVTHAIEVDKWACDTLAANHRETRVIQGDVTAFDEGWITRNIDKYPDLLIGGPPCQGFSHAAVGRQDPKDPRNSLFRDFVRFARVLEPQQVVMENVPGLLRAKTAAGEPVAEIVVAELEALGYNVSVLTLNAHEHGLPQIRRRVFFVASTSAVPSTVPPSHGEPDLLHTVDPFVTLRDAISDLPRVDVGEQEPLVAYTGPPRNDYQRMMRRGASDELANHVPMRHTPRMVARFAAIKPGQSQSHVGEAHAPTRRVRTAAQGFGRYDQNNRRMHWDRPCHTIAATFYANFVHPDLNRNFTPREGARIQSFPDWYVFHGKPTVVSSKLLSREGRVAEKHLCQYVQIGNGVPPLLAKRLLTFAADAEASQTNIRTSEESSNV